jgi:deoxycytidine triphosphate deaminase
MKILSQPGFKGHVLLVPSNLQKTATALPRQTGETEIVALSLKRRLSDKYGSVTQYIRQHTVNNTIDFFGQKTTHFIYLYL